MRSTACKALLALCLALLFLPLTAGKAAYEPEDAVGQPGMLLAAMSGNGSLTDESVLGDACADAVRTALGADLAIIPGGALTGNLEPRPQTYADVCAVLAAPEETLAVAELTAAELSALLEAGVSRVVLDDREAIDREASAFGGFPQVSGFSFTYDVSARPGERIMRIRVNGEEPAEGTRYTLAAPQSLFEGAYGYPVLESRPAEISLGEALADYIASGTGDGYTGKGRITAVGCVDYNLTNRFPVVLCALAAIVIWTGSRLWKFKYADRTTR